MSKAIFPKIRTDGTFCVEVAFKASDDHGRELAIKIQQWLDEIWSPNNSTWTREWNAASPLHSKVEVLQFGDEFIRPPEVTSSDESQITLRLYGKESSRLWRDWFVSRLLPDLKEKFPEIGEGLAIGNCGEYPLREWRSEPNL
jgi:hypothetical protein